MTISPHTTVLCPHCFRDFRVAAWRVVPQAALSCTACGGSFQLDAKVPEFRSAIEGARQAHQIFSRQMRTYSADLPRNISVSERLDLLVRQLSELARR
jgi:hypothetical protein